MKHRFFFFLSTVNKEVMISQIKMTNQFPALNNLFPMFTYFIHAVEVFLKAEGEPRWDWMVKDIPACALTCCFDPMNCERKSPGKSDFLLLKTPVKKHGVWMGERPRGTSNVFYFESHSQLKKTWNVQRISVIWKSDSFRKTSDWFNWEGDAKD